MKYITITPDRFDDVIKYLRYTFFADEPLNKAVQLCKPGEGHAESEKFSRETLKKGLSVMAVCDNDDDDDEIAGVALNSCVTADSKKAALNDLNGQPDEKFKKICNLLYSQNLRVNLFKEFDVNELFEVTILSVNPKFRGQGIAKQLLIQSEQIARDNGFRVMKSDATGLFSQRVQTSLGFKPCLELRYDEYCDKNNKPIFVVEPPHEVFQILYKSLDGDENVTSF